MKKLILFVSALITLWIKAAFLMDKLQHRLHSSVNYLLKMPALIVG